MFKIIVGCYEQFLLGYDIKLTKDKNYEAVTSFTDHSHTGCIKTVTVGGDYLASGSSDEIIYLFNLRKNEEVGALYGHDGSVTKLIFAENNFLFSASEDGNIIVYNASKNWDKLKVLHGHKAGINDISVHPSGKLALSVSKDGTLRTWNLITGRSAYVKNVKYFKPEIITWDPFDGEHYVMASLTNVQIFELATANKITDITFKKSILTLQFVGKNTISVGGEAGAIEIYNIISGKLKHKVTAHTARIKYLHVGIPNKEFLVNEDTRWLISASSNGEVKFWEYNVKELENDNFDLKCILEMNTGARITCVTSWTS